VGLSRGDYQGGYPGEFGELSGGVFCGLSGGSIKRKETAGRLPKMGYLGWGGEFVGASVQRMGVRHWSGRGIKRRKVVASGQPITLMDKHSLSFYYVRPTVLTDKRSLSFYYNM